MTPMMITMICVECETDNDDICETDDEYDAMDGMWFVRLGLRPDLAAIARTQDGNKLT